MILISCWDISVYVLSMKYFIERWTYIVLSEKCPVCEMSYLMKYAISMQFHILKFPIYNFVIFEMSIYMKCLNTHLSKRKK